MLKQLNIEEEVRKLERPANYKNKKQIYVWPENLEFFMGLPNKSRTMNLLMKKYKEEVENAGESAN